MSFRSFRVIRIPARRAIAVKCTMTLVDQNLYIQAGAGVVADSDPESEYQETINKASALEQTVHLTEKIFSDGNILKV